MAAASGVAASGFAVANVELLVRRSSPARVVRFGVGPMKTRVGVPRGPRCEVGAPDSEASRASSLSALEQFKISGTDRYMKERSSIAVIGLSVHTAPVEMREKLAIPEAQWPRAIGELCDLNHIEEAAVLSTCNRMEIYVLALSWHRGIREVTEWMAKLELSYIRFLV